MTEKLPLDILTEALSAAAQAAVTAINDYSASEFAREASVAQLARIATTLETLDKFRALYLGSIMRQLPARELRRVRDIVDGDPSARALTADVAGHA